MKYAIWFFRLLFAAWMIPAGLNHFIALFPQPMGNAPLSMELIIALIDSGLFDLVKAVELIAGVMVLFGFYTPLALLICLPVSFGVFYWDAPLEGWTSGASRFGYATLFVNSVLCLAWYKNYLGMFTLKTQVSERQQLVMIGRLVLGAGLVLYAANVLFLSLWSAPTGSEGLAAQLMTSLTNSNLLHVALWMQLLSGILLLAGIMVPLALCIQMNITTNALFWSLFLDQQPLGMLVTLAAFAINGLLMLAYLPYYQGVLENGVVSAGETTGQSGNYDALMVDLKGNTDKTEYLPAVISVLAAFGFYYWLGLGGTAQFSVLVLMYPLFVLLTRRLRDMGMNVWLLLVALVPALVTWGVYFRYFSLGVDHFITVGTLIIVAAFIVWGAIGKSKLS